MKNSNNSPANEIARVAVSPATSNRVYIERVTGTNIAAITGGLDVEGEIVFEIDRGFNS
jgi:filamentous hemagglutinin family protein